MRKIRVGILLLVLTTAATLLGGCKAPVAGGNEEDTAPAPTLRVQGLGQITVEPDIARLTVGVLTSDADAAVAQDTNDAAMSRVIIAIRAAGVEERDIQTTQYYAYPRYDYNTPTNEIIGYDVTHMVTVTVRAVDTVGQVLKAANQAGANQNYDISFDVDDRDAAYQQALTEAVENAKQKAQAIAAPSGVTLGEPSAIYEGTTPTAYDNGLRNEMAAGDVDGGAPVQTGTLTVTAYVTIVYDLQ